MLHLYVSVILTCIFISCNLFYLMCCQILLVLVIATDFLKPFRAHPNKKNVDSNIVAAGVVTVVGFVLVVVVVVSGLSKKSVGR